MLNIIIIFGVAILCVIAGYLLAVIRYDRTITGVLRIDHSDPDEPPYLFVELKGDPSKLEHGRYVRFLVDKTNLVSQK